MKLFKYVYYRICKFYLKDDESSGRITSLALLSVLQTLNVFSILIALGLHKSYSSSIGLIVGLIYFALLIFNFIYFGKHNYDVLAEKWKNEDEATRKRKGFYVQVYIGVSLLLVVALIIR